MVGNLPVCCARAASGHAAAAPPISLMKSRRLIGHVGNSASQRQTRTTTLTIAQRCLGLANPRLRFGTLLGHSRRQSVEIVTLFPPLASRVMGRDAPRQGVPRYVHAHGCSAEHPNVSLGAPPLREL